MAGHKNNLHIFTIHFDSHSMSARKFLNECPSGLITLHEFRRHFCNGTVGKESAEYAEQIFRTLDNNGVFHGSC